MANDFENLGGGYRNRRIGEFLKELEVTEGRSTGIPKILKEMATNGSPAPLFETDDDRLSFVIRLPRHPQALVPPTQLTAQVAAQVTAQVGMLLARMEGEMTRSAMQEAVGLVHREHFRKSYLVPALELGVVEMTQPDKPNSRSQRYRLTAAGRRWLEEHPDC